MSKAKSVVMTTLISIVIVLLCLMCVVPEFTIPFRVNGIWTKYNSVVSVISYGSDLGGGYSAVYYPEGVVSAETYNTKVEYLQDNLDEKLAEAGATKDTYVEGTDDSVDKALYDYNDYVKKYVAYTSDKFDAIKGVTDAAVYMEINEVCAETAAGAGKYVVKDEFKTNFETAIKAISKRFDKKNLSSLSVAVKDGCTVEVKIPYTVDDPDTLFTQMGYTGNFMLKANEEVSTRPLLNPFGDTKLTDYFKGASSIAQGDKGVVQIDLTSQGQKTIYDLTNTLRENETDATLYFYVGENQVIGLGLSNEDDGIDTRSLLISGDSLTAETAQNVAIVINSCIKDGAITMDMSAGATLDYKVGTGDMATLAIYIVLAAVMLGMFVFSIIRYRGLGVAHILGFLSFLICMLMFVAFLPGMLLSASGVFAVVVTGVMTVLFNYYIFENIRKEFATGKTLTTAVKAGYKNVLAPVLDTHILLLIVAFVLMLASVGELVVFSYVFLLGVLMSGINNLLLTRFYAFSMRGLLDRSKQYKFYGFKREVMEDDED